MSQERRKHTRKRVSFPVTFQADGGERQPAEARDMGIGGAFIDATALPFGSKVKVFFTLPGTRHEIAVDAVVRWVQPHGMGVQFGALGARDTYALSEYLADKPPAD